MGVQCWKNMCRTLWTLLEKVAFFYFVSLAAFSEQYQKESVIFPECLPRTDFFQGVGLDDVILFQGGANDFS